MVILHFIIFLSLGTVLGFLYDIFKIFRKLYKNNIFIFVIDTLYFIIYFIIMFGISIKLNFERIRYYMIFECCLGFTIYKVTISKFIFLVEKRIVQFVKKFHLVPKIKLFIFHKKSNRSKK